MGSKAPSEEELIYVEEPEEYYEEVAEAEADQYYEDVAAYEEEV